MLYPGCKPKETTTSHQQMSNSVNIHAQFQELIDSMLQEVPNAKGISMHVEAPEQQISWTGATGWADSADNRKLQPTDPALIASITITYVAATILRLVEKGNIFLNLKIDGQLSAPTQKLMEKAGYLLGEISIAQLCSHTSGITDYVNTEAYQSETLENPDHVWTRDEQIALALSMPISDVPGAKFEYSETNYLLLTEVIETQTGIPFYVAMRDLLSYGQQGLNETWFVMLEEAPPHLSPLAHQFAGEFQVESHALHPSFDLYGGGGIAATPKDVARFTQALFAGQLFDHHKTTALLYYTTPTADGKSIDYSMGIAKTQLGPYTAYGHGGFWGTTTQYFPKLNASVSIFLMERDEWHKYQELLEKVAQLLSQG